MNILGSQDISGLIAAWGEGDEHALDRLMPLVYPELRQIARRYMARCQAGNTLESAALDNEAYLKLVRAGNVRCESRVHFLALCAQVIRRILVDHARNRGYAKRGGGAVQVPLDEEMVAGNARQVDVLALDEALAALSEFDPRKGRVVELRYFAGLSVEETSEAPGDLAGDSQTRLEDGQGLVVWRTHWKESLILPAVRFLKELARHPSADQWLAPCYDFPDK